MAEFRRHVGEAQTWQLLFSALHVMSDVSLLEKYGSRIGKAGIRMMGTQAGDDAPGIREELIRLLEDFRDL